MIIMLRIIFVGKPIIVTKSRVDGNLTGKYRYSTEPFAAMNGKIPQVNLWDDHDVSCLLRNQFITANQP